MPTYPYRCNKCGLNVDVIKPMSLASVTEVCPACTVDPTPMERIYTVPQVDMGGIPVTGYYNHGLGAWINSKAGLREAQKRAGAGYTKTITNRDGSTRTVTVPDRQIVNVGDAPVKTIARTRKPDSYDLPNEVWDKVVKE